MLNKIARTPPHLRGLVNGCCTAGNLGNLVLIIVPAVCDESDSPFGDSSTCETYGDAYASVSAGVSSLFIWTYLYMVMGANMERNTEIMNTSTTSSDYSTITESLNPSTNILSTDNNISITQYDDSTCNNRNGNNKMSLLDCITWPITKCNKYIKLEMVFTPSTIAVIIGFIIGAVSPIQKLMVGDDAPLRAIIKSIALVGEGTIVSMTLIVGANLLDGLKQSGIRWYLTMGIMIVRFIVSPILGILIVKAAYAWGLVGSYNLYQFVLMLQYALPPATSAGTIAQLIGVAESECSLIMLWTYAVSTVTLTLWCTFFMWMLD
ncbi:hypothetical protein PIB30_024810 [Stylosanthes scabra]|uniref:PIN-like protein n=1 Tax=Stylosanthes scabra TaxID=79078 RepID=A0ABU6XBK0_9FABA|nr:hypothetical protein [Stylosanthes scabra]